MSCAPRKNGLTTRERRIAHYIVVVPDGAPKQASPLHGCAPSLCRNHWMLYAAFLPSTIYELTKGGQEKLPPRRMSGANPINRASDS